MSVNVASAPPNRQSLTPVQSAGAKPQARQEQAADEVKAILDAVRSTRFGEVTVIIQDGLVVQVNRLEKRRLR